uniref:Uncharacterized protein n=1 Tax=Tanacetum cinerariifolium TaxID=118510 RepID=A0A6L2P424_TANCI|nr:hypothetical protein [Tanacetum cinerariifolium]
MECKELEFLMIDTDRIFKNKKGKRVSLASSLTPRPISDVRMRMYLYYLNYCRDVMFLTFRECLRRATPVPFGLLFKGGLATTWDFLGFHPIFKDTERNVPFGLLFKGGLATTWDFLGFYPIFKDTERNVITMSEYLCFLFLSGASIVHGFHDDEGESSHSGEIYVPEWSISQRCDYIKLVETHDEYSKTVKNLVTARLFQSHEYKKSLSKPFNMAIQAGWGKGLSEGRTEEDILAALHAAEDRTDGDFVLGFQTLCKQGDWFSFAKRRVPSPVCIDDNRSCMKHWKSGFFFIDRMDILDSMVWRHPSAAINDPRPAAGSFSMADVRLLSVHVGVDGNVIGIHDILCLLEWTSDEVQKEPHLDVRPTLRRLPFYCTPSTAADDVIPDLTPEDLVVGTPSSKILAKVEACDDDGSDDDYDACVEIPLVTPLHSTAVILSLGNQGGSSATFDAEGSNPRGKGIMADDAVASSVGGVAGNYKFTREEWDAPYRPAFGVLTKEVFKELAVCKTVVDQFLTPREMVQVESLSDDQLTANMSVLHYMMMSHGGEILARYRRLNQSHHEYVLSADSRLKGYEEKVAILTGLELQVSTLKKQVSGLNDKISSSNDSFAKSKAKGKKRKKKIKYLTKSLDNLHVEVAHLSADLNRATILEAKKDKEILHLKATPLEFSSFFRGQFQGLFWKFLASDEFSKVQGELLSLAASTRFEHGLSMHHTKDEFVAVLKKMDNFMHDRPVNVPTSKDSRISPPIAKESTVTPASKSLEISTNVALASSIVTLEQNEEWINVIVDGPDAEMNDGVAHSKSGSVFVQGTSHALDDAIEVTVVGSERVSFGLTDVVVAISTGEKGDGSLPSSTIDEEAAVNPYVV